MKSAATREHLYSDDEVERTVIVDQVFERTCRDSSSSDITTSVIVDEVVERSRKSSASSDISSKEIAQILKAHDITVTTKTETTSEFSDEVLVSEKKQQESVSEAKTDEKLEVKAAAEQEATMTKVMEDDLCVDEEKGQAPKFVKPPEPVYVDIGETIHLSCIISG